ncbi:M20/M25/M40 family metallo-hydrolase [Sphingomonas cannabina]|uniref:M20/M25/M40 family metallo-hydrolase n=1 Tax=Sphingomonas cannabina TaxID=2899123 RepID=UPI001F368A31|nr:M20/M25/M40 family metallo-hydrolase [Sphingomonas cannabina]UIJ46857.1 M20/M25/M40 family metallo-hydrolase [Sphingomonas cannabina]
MIRTPSTLIAAGLAVAGLPAAAQSLAPTEAKMKTVIAAEQDRDIALLERAVNQNSGTLNLEGVRKVGDIFRTELEPLGFTVRWIDQSAVGRAGHLIATHKGNGRGKRILLIGHLDTVFEPDSPFQKFVRDGNRATGPGTSDMKGGNVVIVAAMRAMQAAGTLKGADIQILLTGDEERTGTPLEVARKDLIEAGQWADVALEYEGLAEQDGRDMGTVARRSAASWELRTSGKTGHSGGVFGPSLGYGAIYEMARILDDFRRELPEPNLTYNVGVLAGGTPAEIDSSGFRVTAQGKTNVVAASAVARGDLRSLTPEQDARAREKMQAIVAKHLAGTDATLKFFDSYPPMAPTEGNRALLAKLNGVNRDLGLEEMGEYDPAKRGAADSGFVAAYADTLGGMGVGGGGAHAEGEWVDLDSIQRQALRSAVLISRLAKERR